MTFTKKNADGKENVFVLTFDATPAEFNAAVNEAYETNKEKYSVQGFRKGKVPKKILEGMYGKGLFYEDALDILMPKYYEEALSKEKLEPVAQPDVDVTKIDETGVQFTITVTTMKPFTVGQYKGLVLKKAVYSVTDEAIENELKQAQEQASRVVTVEDRPAQNGDTVTIDFSGAVNGVKFDGGTAENHELELGSASFIPGFEEQVVGLAIGAEKDVTVKFPEDYHAEDLKGKEAVFRVKLNGIKVKELPPLDDELAKDASEFDTLDAFKASIRAKLETENAEKAKNDDEKAVIEKISEATEIEVPDSFIDREVESLVRQFEYRLMYQGLKIKDYFKYTGQDESALRESYRVQAAKNVKTRLIMEEIIKSENLTVDDEKLEQRLKELADHEKKTVEEYKKEMNPNQFDYFANEVLTDSLFDFLTANNKFE